MAVNIPHVLILLVVITALLVGYYLKMNVQEGESKSFKLFKLVLMILIGLGIIGLFAMSQSDEFKAFWVILITILLNVFTVIHSTTKCDYPKLYIIQLSLYSALLVAITASILWYTHFHDLLGLFVTDLDSSLDEGGDDNFDSDELSMGQIYEESTEDCPDRDDEDYDTHIQLIRDNNPRLYNDCLEAEVRQDLENEL